jgi:two-component system, NarL family, sensor kinase
MPSSASSRDDGSAPALAAALEASELDRRRIARELHDHLGQTLAAANIALDTARITGAGSELLDEAQHAVQESARTTREFTFALRAPQLIEKGVGQALRAFAQGISERRDDAPAYHFDVSEGRWSPALEAALYRIGQEALRNCVQHAAARNVGVSLVDVGGDITLIFADDGRGFDTGYVSGDAVTRQFGLRIVAALARSFSGASTVKSAPGQGTTIAVTLFDPSARRRKHANRQD